MKVEKRIPVWEKGEYQYKGAGAFVPHISLYLHEDEGKRPAMIVCPGGGYFLVSPTEGEIVARSFYEKGYNCFVLTYTTNPTGEYPLMNQPLKDISRTIRFVRANAKAYCVDEKKVYICGFSAAGHLCASICDYHQEITEENPKYLGFSNRPDAAILSYPVISSGEMAHQGSFQCLTYMDVYDREDEEAKALLERYSLEKHVTENNPPAFLWHTVTDALVPVENSLLYEQALREKGVRHALHLYSDGHHGTSVANEEWAAKKSFGEFYTFDQLAAVKEALEKDELPVKAEKKAELLQAIPMFFQEEEPGCAFPEITSWPDLADAFLKELEK